MVKVKEKIAWIAEDGSVNLDHWYSLLRDKGYTKQLETIQRACTLSQFIGSEQATESGVDCFKLGLTIADILADLHVDPDTLIAGILFESSQYAEVSFDVLEAELGSNVVKLIKGVGRMGALHQLTTATGPQTSKLIQNKHQIDNLRKMLLAMVDDPRVVLIKLAERLCVLRTAVQLPIAIQHQLASEAMDIYAPLANRLGIGAIKWELEDLAFRYLHADEYKTIAKGLKAKRLERDRFVNQIVDTLNMEIKRLGIEHYDVYGRSKHIHSIYRKMIRKNVPLEEIYDATAVRILVDSPEQCYGVLGLVHHLWHQIPAEYDDYISHPKTNGYQSLHTAVTDPDGRVFEVQIRTFAMHDRAEMGVAAHWKYKEGAVSTQQGPERKIAWLRDVLAWHREVAVSQGMGPSALESFLDDRIYVFTPGGDVIELPQGVTPLDFAYHVHSQLGHRCRGAKVNGTMVTLTYELKTGDRVEILTGKQDRPSRDWINPHLNYLKTSRAKAKVLHWFRMQDYESHKALGEEILEKEFKNLGLRAERLESVVESLHLKKIDDLYAALGRGDIKINQIIQRLQPVSETPQISVLKTNKVPQPIKHSSKEDLIIEGVGNLLTHMARCCQPLPGDPVVGYITLGHGVSIHRQDCDNILHASEKQQQRFLQVHWRSATQNLYQVQLGVRAFDRPGLLRDVTALLSTEKLNIFALDSRTDTEKHITHISFTVEIDSMDSLSRLLSRLQQIPNVLETMRLS